MRTLWLCLKFRLTGQAHRVHTSHMRNPFGFLTRRPGEWGNKTLKEESRLRGFSHTSREEAIADQLANGAFDDDWSEWYPESGWFDEIETWRRIDAEIAESLCNSTGWCDIVSDTEDYIYHGEDQSE